MRFGLREQWNQRDCGGVYRQLEPITNHLGRLSTGGNKEIPTDL